MIKAGIFGASGYTGIELLKILRRHPQVEVVFGTSESSAGKTLSEVIEDSLRESLARRKATAPRRRINLPTFKGTGLMPGVDLNNNAALLDLMEEGVDVNSRR